MLSACNVRMQTRDHLQQVLMIHKYPPHVKTREEKQRLCHVGFQGEEDTPVCLFRQKDLCYEYIVILRESAQAKHWVQRTSYLEATAVV